MKTETHEHAHGTVTETPEDGPAPAHENHTAHGDHGGGHGDHAAMFRTKFWLSLVLTIPAVIYSHMLQDLLGYTAPMFWGHGWVAPILGTIVFLYGGPVFLKGGWSEIKSKQPGMMLLISMGLLVAFGASVATKIG